MSSKKQLATGRRQLADIKKLTILWVLAALVISYVSQLNYDAWRRYSPGKISVDYNVYIEPQPPSPMVARALSFGATEALADWYWLTLIQYYGGGTPNGKYRKLAELFDLVSELSPKFATAYETGLVILPGEGFVDEALLLGAKGERNLPEAWQPPYYTGLVYHIYKKDYLAAARAFERAATKPNAPDNAKYFAGIYYAKADSRQTAYLIFKNIAESTTSDFIRERSLKYLGQLDLIIFLEDSAGRYRAKYNRWPANLEELVRVGLIETLPANPLGRPLVIDPQTGEVREKLK